MDPSFRWDDDWYWIPAWAGMTSKGWIPAFAGMTSGWVGRYRRLRQAAHACAQNEEAARSRGFLDSNGTIADHGRRASSASSRAFGIRSCLLAPSQYSSGQATKIDDSVPSTMPNICEAAMPSSELPP
jgi:hypothetical protein